MIVLFYILNINVWEIQFLGVSSQAFSVIIFILFYFSHLDRYVVSLIMALICIYPTNNDVEQLFMCLYDIYIM